MARAITEISALIFSLISVVHFNKEQILVMQILCCFSYQEEAK